MNNSSFSQQDYLSARESLNCWRNQTNETVDELVMRKRKAELRQLVKAVIKNELSHEEQLLVKLHWYDGLSQSRIAEQLGVDRSRISRKMTKINEVIYDKLKYAIEFRYGKSFIGEKELIITDSKAKSTTVNSDEISKRLIKLRREQCFEIEDISRLSGIDADRLRRIEQKGSAITVAELKKLAVLFRVTSDYILFGSTGQLH